jgi:hypothetical protein
MKASFTKVETEKLTGLSLTQLHYLNKNNFIKPNKFGRYNINQLIWLGVFKAFRDKGYGYNSIISILKTLFKNAEKWDDFDLRNYAVIEVSPSEKGLYFHPKSDEIVNVLENFIIQTSLLGYLEKTDKILGNLTEHTNYIEINGKCFILIYKIIQQIIVNSKDIDLRFELDARKELAEIA